ncbi:hypothetical protein SUGI_0233350 [Cryptomeria japonica]|nr:hypothetical protein SUGI_0233350 [Cryptomeria japonica]
MPSYIIQNAHTTHPSSKVSEEILHIMADDLLYTVASDMIERIADEVSQEKFLIPEGRELLPLSQYHVLPIKDPLLLLMGVGSTVRSIAKHSTF